jgi:ABC-type dipeptide/oligopeptide/nickel transport system permease component
VAALAVSFPNFVVAIALIVLFVLALPVIPRTGGWGEPVDWILPSIALGLGPLGVLARYTRSSLVDVLGQEYIRTATAKGLSERRVIGGHALRNAALPLLTVLGPMVARVGTGSFFVETIFRVPGMGRYFVDSMTARDYPLIMAVILVFGSFLAVMNLLVDLLYGWLDPRLRSG